MGKRKKGLSFAALVVFGGLVLFILNKDFFIAEWGIRKTMAFQIVTTIIGLALVAMDIQVALAGRRERKLEAIEEKAAVQIDSRLKMTDNEKLRTRLYQMAGGYWKDLNRQIIALVRQLERMDEMQARLHRLLENNNAKTLADAEDVLEQTEKHLIAQIKKAVNYMTIYEAEDIGALEEVKKLLTECREKNEEVLNQAQDFLVAIAEFINDQGGDSAGAIHALETYKQTIIGMLSQ